MYAFLYFHFLANCSWRDNFVYCVRHASYYSMNLIIGIELETVYVN